MLRRLFGVLVVVLALTASWSCSGGNSAVSVQNQGIRGTTTLKIYPGIPNVPPTIEALPGAIVTVQPAGGGGEITRQTADADGKFEIVLPVGTYLIVPLQPEPNNASITVVAPQQNVIVRPDEFATINLEYKSLRP
jgi:hypothetical protein